MKAAYLLALSVVFALIALVTIRVGEGWVAFTGVAVASSLVTGVRGVLLLLARGKNA